MRCELVSWARVARLVRMLAAEIRSSGYQPERVIAIARGGYVPARLLCDRLNGYALDSIRIAHYRAGGAKSPEARLVCGLASDIRGQDVLLVDDVADTGDTLALAAEYLQSLGPRTVRVAVLHYKRQSPFKPDYWAEEVVTWRWLTFPWAVVEDLGGLLAAMQPPVREASAVIARFEAEYGLRLSRSMARDLLAWSVAPPAGSEGG